MFFLAELMTETSALAQNIHLVDSLEKKLYGKFGEKQIKNDSLKADLLCQLSINYWGNNPDKAMGYAQQSLLLSRKIKS